MKFHRDQWFVFRIFVPFGLIVLYLMGCTGDLGPEYRVKADRVDVRGREARLGRTLDEGKTFFYFGGQVTGESILGDFNDEEIRRKVYETLLDAGFTPAPPDEYADLAIFAHYGVGSLKSGHLNLDNAAIASVSPAQFGADSEFQTIYRVLPDFDGGMIRRITTELEIAAYEIDRYFIIISAYDFTVYRESEEYQRVWQTIVSAPFNDGGFNELVDGLLLSAKPFLGETLQRDAVVYAPESKVGVGEIEVIDIEVENSENQ